MKTNDKQSILDLLRKLLTKMIAYPGDLIITPREFEASMTVTIQGHAADTGRLIGEGAGNYRAICLIMQAVAMRRGVKIVIPSILDPVTGSKERYSFLPNSLWPKEEIIALLNELAAALFQHPEAVEIVVHEQSENNLSTINVMVSRSERSDLVKMLDGPVEKIFDCIGRNNGRLIKVNLIQSKDGGEQPASAAGRFVGEVQR